ncbi:MAG: hypothetical protein KDK36_16740 [Leptospiraceae bacterium]|nr:hypothetical protein [Leptospiraceae bacterium]
MKKESFSVSGYIVYKFKKMKIVSPSELRNNSTRNYNKQSSSYKYFLKEMEESLLENSFDIEKYEETKMKAESMYEMVIGYSEVLLMKKDSHIYCKEAFINLVKESSDKIYAR